MDLLQENEADDEGENFEESEEVIAYSVKSQKQDKNKIPETLSAELALVQNDIKIGTSVLKESIEYFCAKHNLSAVNCLNFESDNAGT